VLAPPLAALHSVVTSLADLGVIGDKGDRGDERPMALLLLARTEEGDVGASAVGEGGEDRRERVRRTRSRAKRAGYNGVRRSSADLDAERMVEGVVAPRRDVHLRQRRERLDDRSLRRAICGKK